MVNLIIKEKTLPDDVKNICWKFFFISFDSSIIKSDKDLNDLFALLSQKISVKRMENAKLLYKGTRDYYDDCPFPYDKLTHKGPYLFIIESMDGSVFGGYSTVDIEMKNRAKSLRERFAFLWVLKSAHLQKPVAYSIVFKEYVQAPEVSVLYDSNSSWLVFGPHGGDLVLYNELMDHEHRCLVNQTGYTRDNIYYGTLKYEIPHGKTLIGTKTEYKFKMSEIEIFSIPR